MGARLSAEQQHQVALDLRISQRMERDSMDQGNDIKFALGGLDFAGKKTILRQIKATFDPHYRQENPGQFVPLLHEHIVAAMKQIVAGTRRLHEYKLEQNRLIRQARLDTAKLAEAEEAEAAAMAAAEEAEDEDSSSEVTADTDDEEEAAKAKQDAEAAKANAEAAAAGAAAAANAAGEEAQKKKNAKKQKKKTQTSDSEDESSDSDSFSDSNSTSDGDGGGGGGGSKGTQVEEGMERIPDLKKLDNYFRVVEMYDPDERIAFEHVDVFLRLWNSWEVQETMRLRDVLQLRLRCDIKYFMEKLEEVVSPEYEPQHEAILRVPCAAALHAIDVREIDHVTYTMIDLSSQRNKLSKWLHMLSNLSSIIFVVAIDEFDLSMEHDPTLNRITESAKLLRRLLDNTALRSKKIAKFLWFSKIDSFSRKIKHVDIRDKDKRRFMDYEHGLCVCTDSRSNFGYKCSCKVQDRAIAYLREQFLKMVPDVRTQFRLQVVEGVDKYSVRTAFGTARDVMLKKAIYGLGDWV